MIAQIKNLLRRTKKTTVVVLVLVLASEYSIAQPKIIIKFDDIGVKNNVCQALPVFNDIMQRKLKATIGIIADKLDGTAKNVLQPYIDAKDDSGRDVFELFNHGYDHSGNNPPNHATEFKGTSYDFQLDHFNEADKTVKDILGVQMRTFGPPFNYIDSNTVRVIGLNKHYRVFLFSGTKNKIRGITNLNNRVDMEIAAGNVSYDYFVTQYNKYKDKYSDYMILQGHPNSWDANKRAEFDKILDFLVSQGCVFVLPTEYALQLRKEN